MAPRSSETRSEFVVKVVPAIADIPAAAWDACANPSPATFDPFVSHAFLRALEDAGCVGHQRGWGVNHLVLEDSAGRALACAPCYLKSHSRGEYVFDYGWADAYERAGGRYYPKLQVAVPFTPVPGRRLLVRADAPLEASESALLGALMELSKRLGASSVHITFQSHAEHDRLGAKGLLQRHGQQFHWTNAGYTTFDDFLASLSSRKRKVVQRERREAQDGVSIRRLRGDDITEAHWDAFFRFYMDTGSRKWGSPYLNRKFFSLLGQSLADRCLLIIAERGGRPIAGALNLIGGDCLCGRYWGAIEHRPFLHFEVCYYQAIEYAIEQRLPRVEAGAQGEHKLARGYLPVATYSTHWIADPRFARAVADYLEQERDHIARANEELAEAGPYRRGPRTADEEQD
jgi:hypothetical protein